MKYLLAVLLLMAVGCEADHFEERCVDGKTYYRNSPDQAWKMEDGAPSHSGVTPVPCVVDKQEPASK